MTTETSPPHRFPSTLTGGGIVLFLLGGLLGAGVTWLIIHPRATDEVPVDVLTGSVKLSGDKDAMVMRVTSGDPADGFGYNPANHVFGMSMVPQGAECLHPWPRSTNAKLGMVFTKPTAGGPGSAIVAWVQCISGP